MLQVNKKQEKIGQRWTVSGTVCTFCDYVRLVQELIKYGSTFGYFEKFKL